MQQRIRAQIERVKALGASYVDARWYPFEETQSLVMWNGNLKQNTLAVESGLGVRVLYKGAWGFCASSSLDDERATFDRALDNARVASERVAFPVCLADKEAVQATFTSPCITDPFTVEIGRKVAFLRRMDSRLDQKGVSQRIGRLTFVRKNIVFLDSEQTEIEKRITEVFALFEVDGNDAQEVKHERKLQLGSRGLGSRGWESIDDSWFEAQGERIVRELNQVLVANECPKDNRSVILLPGIMFLQTHETIGHALELDRILGYELSYAGGSFVTLKDFGTLHYGSEKLTARADATLPNSPGSFGYDDDGIPCQNTLLIDKGILVGAITGRQMAEEANARAGHKLFAASGGCNRAAAFYRVPIERMTNINVDPGTDGSLEDIVASSEKAIIVDGDRSWSIGSNREQFHFGTEIGWLVEDGEIREVVKNATYKGDTLEFWNSLSAVGGPSTCSLEFVDNCGKGQPNQTMQLGHAIPVCRFDNVSIGE